ncbi:DUF2267 domain-containing protein [Nonomuraea sp. K274]|uniref:DUF2267 domain-containing protein n=1 Tax=Nonomuraea cypriaca TaxID=1187855 RepID=A0A931AGF4_9ACTN|nr:DUF2267 domain-containing protein [Nonomuraea cypriaca]MBF8190584.1 DUF2267 domain-containing protein [Nonomuraea cypriaca]
MAETGYAPFNRTVDKTNRILREIEEAHGWSAEHRNQSYAALRAVLHALRDRLTVDESAHLAAQLPLLIRGVYYDGWRPSVVPVKADRAEFLERVAKELAFDFPESEEDLVKMVLRALRKHITDGEWEDVKSSMPRDLASILP